MLIVIVCASVNRGLAAPPIDPNARKLADGEQAPTQTQALSGTGVSLNYATGFEPAQGFTARDATCWQDPLCVDASTGQCGFIHGQGSGPYPEPWAVSGGPTQIEAHIDNVHPFSGTQHLRFSHDACDDVNPFTFAVDARIPGSPPQLGIVAPATYRGQIAIDGLFGVNVIWQPQSNSQGYPTSRTLFYYYGWFYILDDRGSGTEYVPVSTNWDATGTYKEFAVHHDPCDHFRCEAGYGSYGPLAGQPCPNGNIDCSVCIGGDNDYQHCLYDDQCPGGYCAWGHCAGRVDYYYDGQLIYQGLMIAGTTSEQFLVFTDNLASDVHVDLDDVVVETGEPCPLDCGNGLVEYNNADDEECDGASDWNCPGRCVPPGETGPHGEAECKCIVDGQTCEQASPLPNGTTHVLSHGGWWTFVADTEATAIETCGTETGPPYAHDTHIYVMTGTCDSLELIASNDDCGAGSRGAGADPLASCYDPRTNFQYFESCTCIATNIGQQYWVYEENHTLGREVVITLTKRQDCAVVWENGACCDRINGVCADDVAEADCQGSQIVWSAQKYCAGVGCEPATGACCDRSPDLGGVCTEGVLFADCQGSYQVWTIDATCADVTCTEVRGACCDGVTGNCANGKLRSECQGQSQLWSPDQLCADVTCDPDPGACCDHINPDPLSRIGVCTNGVIMADCQGASRVWTKGTTCAQVECVADFQAIPTVSEWGLVVLAIVLVVMAKLAFRQLRTARDAVS